MEKNKSNYIIEHSSMKTIIFAGLLMLLAVSEVIVGSQNEAFRLLSEHKKHHLREGVTYKI